MSPESARMATEEFVSLATFRRSGEAVATPVWVARDGDDLIVTTPTGTGKTKRLKNDPRVTMRPCGRLGKVDPDAPTLEGTAVVEPETDRETALFREKYGVQYTIVLGIERMGEAGRRPRSIVRITPTA